MPTFTPKSYCLVIFAPQGSFEFFSAFKHRQQCFDGLHSHMHCARANDSNCHWNKFSHHGQESEAWGDVFLQGRRQQQLWQWA
jgi:hypothetical protein